MSFPFGGGRLGAQIVSRAETLAKHSDAAGALTVAYLTPAHRAVGAQIEHWMIEAGMQVEVDAVGNVVGRYAGATPDARVLMTGSHFDTVRNGGKFDGRLGILLPIAVVGELNSRGERLPYALEVVAFAEEEGLRYRSGFLASSALVGQFDYSLLDRADCDGITLRDAMTGAGLPGTEQAIAALARDGGRLRGYVEVHIEQGPVLLQRGLPLGVVTSIAGSVRMTVRVTGAAGHAGTTPMSMRHDAAAAAAEMVLAVESRCARAPTLVGTVGMLAVPEGSTNVIPGRCEFSVDIRAGDDATRDAAVADVSAAMESIAVRRGVAVKIERTSHVPCAPCSEALSGQLVEAVERAGVRPFRLPSGAGHDAMMLARLTEVAMLFVRCGNGGVSHSPLEQLDAADADLAAQVFADFVRSLH
jgi:allantoate deiminase